MPGRGLLGSSRHLEQHPQALRSLVPPGCFAHMLWVFILAVGVLPGLGQTNEPSRDLWKLRPFPTTTRMSQCSCLTMLFFRGGWMKGESGSGRGALL